MVYGIYVDEVIAPMVHAQQIAFAQSGDKNAVPPSFEVAIRTYDEWLNQEVDPNFNVEEFEHRKVMGL